MSPGLSFSKKKNKAGITSMRPRVRHYERIRYIEHLKPSKSRKSPQNTVFLSTPASPDKTLNWNQRTCKAARIEDENDSSFASSAAAKRPVHNEPRRYMLDGVEETLRFYHPIDSSDAGGMRRRSDFIIPWARRVCWCGIYALTCAISDSSFAGCPIHEVIPSQFELWSWGKHQITLERVVESNSS
ncbi:hypothetical protein K438DRAFT_1751063 [Mycena galopus ATCC 62051]|nr:hypothetical protein K438DRAFT_1751063 [Mycena galopus ATCC 62051]